MVHICDGILLNHKKEWIWVHSSEVYEPRACYTEWRKSEREKQISHINMYIWNLEKWYWWTYLQGSSRDTGASQVVVVVKNMPSSAGDVSLRHGFRSLRGGGRGTEVYRKLLFTAFWALSQDVLGCRWGKRRSPPHLHVNWWMCCKKSKALETHQPEFKFQDFI